MFAPCVTGGTRRAVPRRHTRKPPATLAEALARLAPVSQHYIPWIIGFTFSVGVGHLMISCAMRRLWRAIDLDPDQAPVRPSPWQPEAQGLVERPLYTAAILTGNPGFIAVWLALKTASTWTSWGVNQPGSTTGRVVQGREVYVNFVIGTALSVAFAAAGAYSTTLLEANQVTPAFLLLGATALSTVALVVWIHRRGTAFLARSGETDPEVASGDRLP